MAELPTRLFYTVYCSLLCKQVLSAEHSPPTQECDPSTSGDRLEPGVTIYVASRFIQEAQLLS